jgi:hypothetical protein
MDAYKAIGAYELQLDELAKLPGSLESNGRRLHRFRVPFQIVASAMAITTHAALSSNKSGSKLRVRPVVWAHWKQQKRLLLGNVTPSTG